MSLVSCVVKCLWFPVWFTLMSKVEVEGGGGGGVLVPVLVSFKICNTCTALQYKIDITATWTFFALRL